MNKEQFIMLVVVCTITHIFRTFYEILKHKKIIKPNKVSFVIIFINMAILWMSWFTLCIIEPDSIALAGIIRYSGISLVGIGVIIFFWALLTIKTLESYEGDIVTKGIYSKIRHPMYLGFILWLIGFPIFCGARYSFLLSLIFTANVLLWRYFEEIELEKRFLTYIDYKKKTLF
jgi:protein-S-isoprenylcysteine O-methyltransferase Ste14